MAKKHEFDEDYLRECEEVDGDSDVGEEEDEDDG